MSASEGITDVARPNGIGQNDPGCVKTLAVVHSAA
jgi:hypothetical protein